jgi:U3 small nucleolar RNA-associated protein 13
MVSDALKTTSYRCVPAIQPFYTGGPFAISTNGFFIACVCGDCINIFDIYKDSIISTLKW